MSGQQKTRAADDQITGQQEALERAAGEGMIERTLPPRTGLPRSDADIGSELRDSLNDGAIGSQGIVVDVLAGDVTLTGAVKNQGYRDWAEEVAQRVRGVRSVNNLLRVPSESSIRRGP